VTGLEEGLHGDASDVSGSAGNKNFHFLGVWGNSGIIPQRPVPRKRFVLS
jgi:hypothetical protein